MVGYVDKNDKLREAFDKMLDVRELDALSSPEVIAEARKLEQLLCPKK